MLEGIRKFILFEIVEDISWFEKKSKTITEKENNIKIT